ncbi:MAG: ABC transporter substrate-binding protein [Gammaproteobacteria bacterium]
MNVSMSKIKLLVVFLQFLVITNAHAQSDALRIYIDADFSNSPESSVSIERGLQVALSFANHTLLGRPVEIVRKDHRGNSARSYRHIKQYLEDPAALLIVSGSHSPPLLTHRDYINEHGVLYLVPWAAAGPITRYPSAENWIFRLSVDDTKAGHLIISFAVREKGFKRPFLLLERTGWGRSNEKTMAAAMQKLGVESFGINRFDWDLKERGARAIIKQAIDERSDVIVLVGNAIESSTFARALAAQPENERLPLLSHWGITAGDFEKNVSHEDRTKIDLHFIQTGFSFINRALDPFESKVFNRAKREYPDIKTPKDISSPTGFIHAHDLGLLLVEAATQVSPDVSIEKARDKLRVALENITTPVRGLVKTYKQPFSVFSEGNPDAHEALGINEFVMAQYGREGEITINDWRRE